MPLSKDKARTARLRDNKRRYRERQKQYTLDLEQRLRQLQQRGIEATVEVQAAARIVAEENRHLRSLLYHLGADEDAISAWLRSHMISKKMSDGDDPQHPICQNVASKHSRGGRVSLEPKPRAHKARESGSNNDQDQHLTGPETLLPDGSGSGKSFCVQKESTLLKQAVSAFSNHPQPVPEAQEKEYPGRFTQQTDQQSPLRISSPCKLLSRLTTDSGGNTPQVIQPLADEAEHDNSQDEVSCSTAYRLLVQHATSEEKIDSLARVLEEGCVPSANGGCKMKNKTVAQALVDICL